MKDNRISSRPAFKVNEAPNKYMPKSGNYSKQVPHSPYMSDTLLKEDGFNLLLESGDNILLE